jgi:RHS repeat-associated protein
VVADQLGAPRAIADGGGAILWRWAYQGNAWGEQAPTGNGYAYNLRFPEQYFGRETGLNYNVHRDYDSAAGRYIEFDPLGLTAGPNGYAYVGSDPLTYDDPSGLRADTDLCAGLTAQGCMQMGQLGPDYVTLNVTVPSVFEFGGTITRSGTVFQHGGFTFGSLKSIASGKNWGFNLSMGFLLNPCHSGADVNNLVDGPSKSGALYDVVGGGIVHNGSGTAIEMGVGLGGRSMGTSYAGQVGQIEPGLNYVPMPSR